MFVQPVLLLLLFLYVVVGVKLTTWGERRTEENFSETEDFERRTEENFLFWNRGFRWNKLANAISIPFLNG